MTEVSDIVEGLTEAAKLNLRHMSVEWTPIYRIPIVTGIGATLLVTKWKLAERRPDGGVYEYRLNEKGLAVRAALIEQEGRR